MTRDAWNSTWDLYSQSISCPALGMKKKKKVEGKKKAHTNPGPGDLVPEGLSQVWG